MNYFVILCCAVYSIETQLCRGGNEPSQLHSIDVLFGLNSISTLSVTLLFPNFNSYQSLSWRERSKRNLLHKGGTTTLWFVTKKKPIFISWNIFWHYFYVKRQESSFDFGLKWGSLCILKGISIEKTFNHESLCVTETSFLSYIKGSIDVVLLATALFFYLIV